MLDAAVKALSQILSPPMRRILWRSIALALGLIIVVAIGLQRLLSWFAAALGIVVGSVFLMPAVTALVASIFVDEVAEEVERVHYPADKPGVAMPLTRALYEGVKTALLAAGLYLIALPFFFFAGIGVIVFFIVAAYLLGREYFLLVAMRSRSPEEARAFRKENAALVFTSGCVIAAFVSIPIVNLATPLFGTAFMVHMHKKLSGPRPELLEPEKLPPAAA
jgi:CysZ protein